jgi:hypothetical protein
LLATEIESTQKLVGDMKPESLLPRFVVTGQEAQGQPHQTRVYGLDVSFNDADAKQKLFKDLGARCYAEKFCPLAAFLTTEAWLSKQTDVQPRKDPQRQEVVIICGRSIDGQDCMAIAPVFRDTGNVIRLGKFNDNYAETESLILKTFFESFMETAFIDLKGKGKM